MVIRGIPARTGQTNQRKVVHHFGWFAGPSQPCRKNYVQSLDGNIVLERMPTYALELNPVEYIWGYMKQREFATVARNRLKSMRRRPQLITVFSKQAELPI